MKRSTVILEGALLLASAVKGAGIVSRVSSGTDDVVVLIPARIDISITPNIYLPAGLTAADTTLGTYSVSVSDSLLAVRVNRGINPAVPGLPGTVAAGQAANREDATRKLNFTLTFPAGSGGTTTADGWQVFTPGVTSLTNLPIRTYQAQDIASGRYPLALDATVYAY